MDSVSGVMQYVTEAIERNPGMLSSLMKLALH